MFAKPCRFAAFLVLVLLAALPLPAAPAGAAKSSEWKTYELEAARFSISLPPGWTVVELDPALIDGSLRELGRANPELGRMLGPQVRALVAAGIKFLAVDAAAPFQNQHGKAAGFATNVNVLTERMPAGMTIEKNVAANAAQIEKLAARRGPLVQRMTEVGGRPAGWVEYRVLIDPAKGLEVAIAQLYLMAGDQSLVFTFTTLASQWAQYQPTFASIAERLRILG